MPEIADTDGATAAQLSPRQLGDLEEHIRSLPAGQKVPVTHEEFLQLQRYLDETRRLQFQSSQLPVPNRFFAGHWVYLDERL